MPNKEKTVKTVPKSNGNDAIRTEPTSTDVMIATDVKKGTSNKKREKHKNKQAIKANNNAATASENGLNATSTTAAAAATTKANDHNESDICAVSEELLRRLQCNGISVRRSDGPVNQQNAIKQGENNGSTDKSNPQQKSKQLNNNNNSKAHNKNCQNQSKTVKNVNTSSYNVEISSDDGQTVQCNGMHANQPSDVNHEVVTDSFEAKSQTLPEQTEAATTSKDISAETPSCSSHQQQQQQQQHYSNLPSTSTSHPSECTLPSSLPRTALSVKSIKTSTVEVTFKEYESELQMPDIMRVIQRELSEPYSIYTYRYFIHNWPKLCFLAMDGDSCIGAIVCKLDIHRQMTKRGYIAMLAVDAAYRKLKVGTTLVQKAIEAMLEHNADEVVLETEITNIPALRLYENLGFVRDKRLFDYYLNGVDALRLKLWFK
ncbi:N-alpha-acetyltransferase 30 [Sitodiplosis mosellana]|uniref:N-alpha-acetyltransferase 30 n=1 Tax=Sitodiplosis mosellana TaxID=263140 RepID=UPI0024441776|nr:N-alpha-acetyltransferase 30 [Sitodiplosis mosellana]XP_055315834.1 N-alpha-acetyltransferase 30 [Sitodiplosis mosellana]